MKIYNSKKRISAQLKKAIKNVINHNDQYSGCYFWSNTGNASNRRSQERRFASSNPSFSILTEKGLIEINPELSISCKNFYYSLEILRNEKKSNISILKNMIK